MNTTSQKQILMWRDSAARAIIGHRRMALLWSIITVVLGLPGLIIGPILVTNSLEDKYTTFLSIIIAICSGIQVFFGAKDKSKKHEMAAKEFESLYNDAN